MIPNISLAEEMKSLLKVWEGIWTTLFKHQYTIPTWFTKGLLTSTSLHLPVDLLPPWFCCKAASSRKASEDEKRSRQAVEDIIPKKRSLSLPDVTHALNGRAALILGGLLRTCTVAALSYSRNPFSRAEDGMYRDDLAFCLIIAWKINWEFAGVGLRHSQKLPYIWLDAFGMLGPCKFEKDEWVKFSLFSYSLLPVMAHIPTISQRYDVADSIRP